MEKLQPNRSYHIFNHANGFENIFTEVENYRFFLDKYNQYILPIAETYAYCLLPNHFHLVVRIRRREVLEEVYRSSIPINFSNPLANGLEKLWKEKQIIYNYQMNYWNDSFRNSLQICLVVILNRSTN